MIHPEYLWRGSLIWKYPAPPLNSTATASKYSKLGRSQSVFYFVPQESHSQAGSTTRNWAILCVTGFLSQFHTTRFSILGQNTPAVVSFELNLTFFHLYWTRRTIMFSWSLKKMVFLLLLLLQLVSLSGAASTSDSIEQVPTYFFKCDHFLSLIYPILTMLITLSIGPMCIICFFLIFNIYMNLGSQRWRATNYGRNLRRRHCAPQHHRPVSLQRNPCWPRSTLGRFRSDPAFSAIDIYSYI